MSSFALSSRRRRLALSVGGALAAALLASPAASRPVHPRRMPGRARPRPGRLVPEQRLHRLQGRLRPEAPTGCGSAAANFVTWTGTGSGAGRIALGQTDSATNPRSVRDPGFRWAGADEPPNADAARADRSGPDRRQQRRRHRRRQRPLHVIPVAIGAITDRSSTCPTAAPSFAHRAALPASARRSRSPTSRTSGTATATTWGDLIPTLDAATCADRADQARRAPRLVRLDVRASSSCSPAINPAHATEWRGLGNAAVADQRAARSVRARRPAAARSRPTSARDTPARSATSISPPPARTPARPSPTSTGTFDKHVLAAAAALDGDLGTYDDPQAQRRRLQERQRRPRRQLRRRRSRSNVPPRRPTRRSATGRSPTPRSPAPATPPAR